MSHLRGELTVEAGLHAKTSWASSLLLAFADT